MEIAPGCIFDHVKISPDRQIPEQTYPGNAGNLPCPAGQREILCGKGCPPLLPGGALPDPFRDTPLLEVQGRRHRTFRGSREYLHDVRGQLPLKTAGHLPGPGGGPPHNTGMPGRDGVQPATGLGDEEDTLPGFNDLSYFCRTFKRLSGYSPSRSGDNSRTTEQGQMPW